jgi:translation initiation factor 2 subunit 3
MTRGDSLLGQLVENPGTSTPVWNELSIEFHLFERVVGAERESEISWIKTGENLMLTVGTATLIGVVKSVTKKEINIKLSRSICAEEGSRVAISRKMGARWHLIGAGVIKG